MELETIICDEFKDNPKLLITKNQNFTDRFHSYSLRSNCRITSQPDWGDIYLIIDGEKSVTPSSLLQYIISLRKENHFHEEICELLFTRLYELLKPKHLMVACLYTRRGGIDICPVRCTDDLVMGYATNLLDPETLTHKTWRQ